MKLIFKLKRIKINYKKKYILFILSVFGQCAIFSFYKKPFKFVYGFYRSPFIQKNIKRIKENKFKAFSAVISSFVIYKISSDYLKNYKKETFLNVSGCEVATHNVFKTAMLGIKILFKKASRLSKEEYKNKYFYETLQDYNKEKHIYEEKFKDIKTFKKFDPKKTNEALDYLKSLESPDKKIIPLSSVDVYLDQMSQEYPIFVHLGHATVLMCYKNIHILTDPIFYRIGVLGRYVPLSISPQDMPRIDLVLISHNHQDHLNEASSKVILKKNSDCIIIVPKGDKKIVKDFGFGNIIEMRWNVVDNKIIPDSSSTDDFLQQTRMMSLSNNVDKQEKIKYIFDHINIMNWPTRHWSQYKELFSENKSQWGSYLITFKKKNKPFYSIYFAGDTGYQENLFKNMKKYMDEKKMGVVNIALVPLAPVCPGDHVNLKNVHIGPVEATQLGLDVESKYIFPIHYGTFQLGLEYLEDPIEEYKGIVENGYKEMIKKENNPCRYEKMGFIVQCKDLL